MRPPDDRQPTTDSPEFAIPYTHPTPMPNRLAQETSPYLQQHQNNPVDWYPWGEEALSRARAEDRPILFSVGYSACHWCHVMEHESFEDEATARLMNEHYVNIKVDREERPDIDSIYMNAVQQLTGRGGWPMTVFLTPEGAPFYGGTYFPPEPRHGLPSFRQVLVGVHEAYRDRREEVDRSAGELREMLRLGTAMRVPSGELDASMLDQAYHQIAARYDGRFGGFGGAPKFPQPMVLGFLLRYWRRTGEANALRMVEHTLGMMARGGMYDHIGGGFHRYSVDARWLVPHFEKMLYDNALLSRVYLHAHLATGKSDYRVVTEEILNYVLREMHSPEGGFYSAQDADSEGVEGKFYVWSADEVDELLGDEEGPLFRAYYDVTEGGNFEGHNIAHVDRSLEAAATEQGTTTDRLVTVIERGRERLYQARADRVWPARDEKVLTSWNAMMLRAFAEAAFAFDDERYREVAVKNAEFLLARLRPSDRLLRTYRDGAAKIDAFLEDHALLVDAFISVYEATFDPRWLHEARSLADSLIARFWEPEEGVFYDAALDGEPLIVRPRDVNDTATPSGTSAAAVALLRLSSLTGEDRFRAIAVTTMEGLATVVAQIPQGFGELLSALDYQLSRTQEVVISGSAEDPGTRALLDVLRSRFLPNTVRALRDPAWSEDEAMHHTPLLAQRHAVEGRPSAYVCEHFTCALPVTDAAGLVAQLS